MAYLEPEVCSEHCQASTIECFTKKRQKKQNKKKQKKKLPSAFCFRPHSSKIFPEKNLSFLLKKRF